MDPGLGRCLPPRFYFDAALWLQGMSKTSQSSQYGVNGEHFPLYISPMLLGVLCSRLALPEGLGCWKSPEATLLPGRVRQCRNNPLGLGLDSSPSLLGTFVGLHLIQGVSFCMAFNAFLLAEVIAPAGQGDKFFGSIYC